DPAVDFTVADYRAAALGAINRLLAAGTMPLVVGGSRLYIKSLTSPFVAGPAPDPSLRASWEAEPSEALHRRLQGVDPETAARLHPADRKRIVRALEVFHQSGAPISMHQRRSQEAGGAFDALII